MAKVGIESIPIFKQIKVLRAAVADLGFVRWFEAVDAVESAPNKKIPLQGTEEEDGEPYYFGHEPTRATFFVYYPDGTPFFPVCPIQPCEQIVSQNIYCPDHHPSMLDAFEDMKSIPEKIDLSGKAFLFQNCEVHPEEVEFMFKCMMKIMGVHSRAELVKLVGKCGFFSDELGIFVCRSKSNSGSLLVMALHSEFQFITCAVDNCYNQGIIEEFWHHVCVCTRNHVGKVSKYLGGGIQAVDAIKIEIQYFILEQIADFRKLGMTDEKAIEALHVKIFKMGLGGLAFRINNNSTDCFIVMYLNGEITVSVHSRLDKRIYRCQFLTCTEDVSYNKKTCLNHKEYTLDMTKLLKEHVYGEDGDFVTGPFNHNQRLK